jgi:ubiquinone/menaquinone biosynthesis C-methylase UbiE
MSSADRQAGSAIVPSMAEVSSYFEQLYRALRLSPAFEALGREVYGDGFCWQLGYANAADLSRIAEVASISPADRVLDLCCGLGGVAGYIERLTGARVYGADCGRTARAICADGGALPFKDGAFDALYCLDGFSYAHTALLAECVRVLKPSARFVFLVSLPSGEVDDFAASLRLAGIRRLATELRTGTTLQTLTALASGYVRHATELRAQIGDAFYRGLSREVRDLLDQMKAGRVERVLLFGET